MCTWCCDVRRLNSSHFIEQIFWQPQRNPRGFRSVLMQIWYIFSLTSSPIKEKELCKLRVHRIFSKSWCNQTNTPFNRGPVETGHPLQSCSWLLELEQRSLLIRYSSNCDTVVGEYHVLNVPVARRKPRGGEVRLGRWPERPERWTGITKRSRHTQTCTHAHNCRGVRTYAQSPQFE